MRRRILILAFLLVGFAASARAAERPLYLDPNQPVEKRVDDLLSRMSLEEKIVLLHGDSKFTTAAIPCLNIQRRWMSDGPHGVRKGAEVAQVYVHQVKASLPRPDKELKGFCRIFLKPGEKQTAFIPLDRTAFAFYDPDKGGGRAEVGDFTILVGSSSRDLRPKDSYTLAQATLEKP